MRTKYDGVVYDTKKAITLTDTIRYNQKEACTTWEGKLYKTPRSGRYFVAGKGGSMTVFAGKEKIIRLSEKKAKAWVLEFFSEGYVTEIFN
ncbi:MAG: hypothetical protein JEZ12_13190 [Desulfobacterium sp.]|nr:hypothetical protein [Desulfobacterium sp.]